MVILPGVSQITVWGKGKFPLTGRQANEAVVRLNPDGTLRNYATYNDQGLIVKRVDLEGASHGGVPTPHVVEYDYNTNPKTGQKFPAPQAWVRPAQPDEVFDIASARLAAASTTAQERAMEAEMERAMEEGDGE